MSRRIAALVALAPLFALAACQGAGLTEPAVDQAAATGTGAGTGTGGATKDTTGASGYYAPAARVRCEVSANRSKISIDGNGLSPAGGTFTAKAISGPNSATAPAKKALGDEVEFDFDSDSGDIAAGAVAIASNFIKGGSVTGQILNAAGAVVATSTASCTSK